MKRNKLALTTIILGIAYLLRTKKSRKKLKEQFQQFMNSREKSQA